MLRKALNRDVLSRSWALMQSRGVKESTFLKGIPVDPEAEVQLPMMLKKVLSDVQEKIPEGVPYRTNVESYCNKFLKIISDAPSQAEAEEILGRQYEELIVDATKEMHLVETMALWRPWEHPTDHVPQMFDNIRDIPTNVNAFREFQHELGNQ
eukprot:jgi/Ulvmu1/10130/UM006_0084.1